MISIDQLDVDIIGKLTDNARKGVVELSAELGVSRNTIQARLRRLEDSGVLAGFRPQIDLSAVGIAVQAYVSLELDQRKILDVIAALGAIPQVLEVKAQAGREDLIAHVGSTTLEGLQDLVAVMVAIPGVRHTITAMSVSTPIPYRVQPLLDHVAQGRGYGRSTPIPQP